MSIASITPTPAARRRPPSAGVDETLLEAQKRCLEMVLRGAPLPEILGDLARVVEDQAGGEALAAILLLDAEGRLRTGAAPSLPEDYNAAIDGIAAAPGVGTCCHAAATATPVLTPDIATDSRWSELKSLPLGLGLKAAWSQPIIASDGRVLGTFGTYFRESRGPTSLERRLVETLSQTAALAIERKLAEHRMAEQQNLLNQALDAAEMGTWRYNLLDWRCEFGERARVLYGMDEVWVRRDLDLVRSIVHPDDVPVVAAALEAAIGPQGSGHYAAEYRVRRPEGGWRWLSAWGSVEFEDAGDGRKPVAIAGASRDITERRLAEERQRLMLHELNHRVKNTLATVQSIAMQAIRSAGDLETAGRLIEGRLVSLARAHDILTQESWSGADLAEVVAVALEPFKGPGLVVEAPSDPVRIAAQQALAFAMALHELATNAVKYGALSVPDGRVAVQWRLQDGQNGPVLAFSWRETGGPTVQRPRRRGFGSRLLERGLGSDLGGSTRLDYAPSGVVFEAMAALRPAS
jgi:two-component sensor histidine kinase/PAS domain-containing protein